MFKGADSAPRALALKLRRLLPMAQRFCSDLRAMLIEIAVSAAKTYTRGKLCTLCGRKRYGCAAIYAALNGKHPKAQSLMIVYQYGHVPNGHDELSY